MNAPILPGEVILFLLTILGADSKPNPVIATVLTVRRGAITVAEVNSKNGLAKIVCHGRSGTDGTYWYEYVQQSGEAQSFNVAHLQRIKDRDDAKTATRAFILD